MPEVLYVDDRYSLSIDIHQSSFWLVSIIGTGLRSWTLQSAILFFNELLHNITEGEFYEQKWVTNLLQDA